MRTLRFAFLVLALGACADNTVAGGDDGGGSNPPPPPPRTVDITGTYRIHSTYDMAASLPGGTGGFVNGLIAATDDPDDPSSWLLDQIIATIPPGTAPHIL